MQDLRFIPYVAERDIDLLLLEELTVSSAFRVWLLSQMFGEAADNFVFLGAWHSVTHTTLGESDIIMISKDSNNQKIAILIEDKIDASPQPEQAERYDQRGQIGIQSGHWHQYKTCLFAPIRYLESTSNASLYGMQISYESIADWFVIAQNDSRTAYKASLIREAIEQNRRGYQAIAHPAVSQFWMNYWQLMRSEFPQLRMKKPESIPVGSDWPHLCNNQLGSGRTLIHKFAAGCVDLQIASMSNYTEAIRDINDSLLNGIADVVKAGKSTSIRIAVPVVDRLAPFDHQRDAIRRGLEAAVLLLSISPRVRVPKTTV